MFFFFLVGVTGFQDIDNKNTENLSFVNVDGDVDQTWLNSLIEKTMEKFKNSNSVQSGSGEPEQIDNENIDNNHTRLFHVLHEDIETSKKFNLCKKDVTVRIVTPPSQSNLIDYLERAIKQLFDYIKENISDTAKVGIIFHSDAFVHGPGVLSYRYLKNLSVEDILGLLFKITQST